MHLSAEELDRYAANIPKRRAADYFMLGLSIARVVDGTRGVAALITSIGQLLEEWEYETSGAATQGVKFVLSKNAGCVYPSVSSSSEPPNQSTGDEGSRTSNTSSLGAIDLKSPALYRFNNAVVYEVLVNAHIPFDLNYLDVVVSFCEILERLYNRLFHADSFNVTSIFEGIVKIDTKLKHHFINMVSKELTDFACGHLKDTVSSLRRKQETIAR